MPTLAATPASHAARLSRAAAPTGLGCPAGLSFVYAAPLAWHATRPSHATPLRTFCSAALQTRHIFERDRTHITRGVAGTIGNQGGSMRWFLLGGHGLACASGTALLGLRMPLGTGCAARHAFSFIYV